MNYGIDLTFFDSQSCALLEVFSAKGPSSKLGNTGLDLQYWQVHKNKPPTLG